jgi:hypothetical protein
MLSAMSFGDWLRRLFSSSEGDGRAEDDVALREEYGAGNPDVAGAEEGPSEFVIGGGVGSGYPGPGLAGLEVSEAAEEELEEGEPPPDPAP